MTVSVITALMNSDPNLPDQMAAAKPFWEDFFSKHSNDSDTDLAKALGDVQISYEHKVFDGDRGMGKETMALTCLASLYDDVCGFEDTDFAARVANAFEASMCSIEVKSYALEAARMFHLGDHSEVLRNRIRGRMS